MIYVFFGILAVILIYVASAFNGLVTRRNRVRDSWAQIDVQLKRRFDLIPNLVNTVKGYAKYEGDTLEKVVEARNKFLKASTPREILEANGELSNVLSRLSVVVERYPKLKADESYIRLQEQLIETENKIGFARQFYNDVVMLYNNEVQSFPSNLIAAAFAFREAPYYEALINERENIKVEF